MAYTKQTWQNEVLSGVSADQALFTIKNSSGTIINDDVIIELKSTEVQAGSEFTADRMNHIEDGIEANSAALADYIRGDGWISANETWAYASATTITVPSGAAAKYAVGDRIKWTQNTVKYGVIVAVADTLLTIAVNTDYTVANEAISLNYYSHQASPVGYPQWFNYVPILSQGASTDIAKTVTFAKYNLVGRVVTTKVVLMATGTGTAGSNILITLPIAGVRGRDFAIIGTGLYDDISSNTYCCVAIYTTENTKVQLVSASVTTRGAGVGSNPSLAVDIDDRFELVASYQM